MRNHKAFTLVELLIVIIIISILSGMLVLSIGNAIDKAEATRIISDMVTAKKAMILYKLTYNKYPDGLTQGSNNNAVTLVDDKIGEFLSSKLGNKYTIVEQKGEGYANDNEANSAKKYAGSIFIKYTNKNMSKNLIKQLAIMAPNANIWNSSRWDDNDNKFKYYNGIYNTNTLHLPVEIKKTN